MGQKTLTDNPKHFCIHLQHVYNRVHYDSSLMLLPRSSNIAEGWNNGFASLVSCQNPTIWSFLECARKEQTITDMKIANILARRAFRREWKWVNSSALWDPESSARFFVLYFFLYIYNIDLIKVLLVNLIVNLQSGSRTLSQSLSLDIIISYSVR